MYTFPFALPPFYVAIIRCLGVLEGVAIQVDPGFRIVRDAAQKMNLNLPGSRRWRRRDAVFMIIRESIRDAVVRRRSTTPTRTSPLAC